MNSEMPDPRSPHHNGSHVHYSPPHNQAQRLYRNVGKYTCPMHPQVRQDYSGDRPICGMPLEPKTIYSDYPV
jgi:P-type Cu+ transporter